MFWTDWHLRDDVKFSSGLKDQLSGATYVLECIASINHLKKFRPACLECRTDQHLRDDLMFNIGEQAFLMVSGMTKFMKTLKRCVGGNHKSMTPTRYLLVINSADPMGATLEFTTLINGDEEPMKLVFRCIQADRSNIYECETYYQERYVFGLTKMFLPRTPFHLSKVLISECIKK